MQRRNFIKTVASVAAVGSIAGCTGSTPKQKAMSDMREILSGVSTDYYIDDYTVSSSGTNISLLVVTSAREDIEFYKSLAAGVSSYAEAITDSESDADLTYRFTPTYNNNVITMQCKYEWAVAYVRGEIELVRLTGMVLETSDKIDGGGGGSGSDSGRF